MIANERGMTLIEVLVAMTIITVGLTAIATGMQLGTSGISSAQQETTATFLAEQKIEDIKAFALSTATAQGFTNVTAANFPAEAYKTLTGGYNGYRRTTSITDPSATMKVVAVSVFYVPVGVSRSANAERQVRLTTVLRQR
ncbi:MAG: prepilin-type N-terminal cleavage/methylation domain-containing protein [Candidatus Rokubacteria bacterium]|nr:prepilin-type N-terminal cleavage/methylation domain-containing protein [Candidatus Rokubacteria bacterium]